MAILGYVEMARRFLLLWGVSDDDWLKAALNSVRICQEDGNRHLSGAIYRRTPAAIRSTPMTRCNRSSVGVHRNDASGNQCWRLASAW